MKPHHSATLALIVLAACGPDIATINNANQRAERAAKRAQAAQLRAERSSALAEDAVKRTEEPAQEAQDVMNRMCGFICDSCGRWTGPAREQFEKYQIIRYEACTGHPWPYPVPRQSK